MPLRSKREVAPEPSATRQSPPPSTPNLYPLWFPMPPPQLPGSSAPSLFTASQIRPPGNIDLQEWEIEYRPPGGFLSYFSKPSPGGQSQPINDDNKNNGADSARTEKRLAWTRDEDLKLVYAVDGVLDAMVTRVLSEQKEGCSQYYQQLVVCMLQALID